MAGRIPELFEHAPGTQGAAQQRQRTLAERIVGSMSREFVWPGDAVFEGRTQGNAWTLLQGDHGGFVLRKPSGDVLGVPGASVLRDVTFDSSAMVVGVTFESAVNLTATASVTFHNCRFLRPIAVATGGVISCHGCTLDGTAAITHAGPAGNANRYGCVGDTLLGADGPNVTIWGGL